MSARVVGDGVRVGVAEVHVDRHDPHPHPNRIGARGLADIRGQLNQDQHHRQAPCQCGERPASSPSEDDQRHRCAEHQERRRDGDEHHEMVGYRRIVGGERGAAEDEQDKPRNEGRNSARSAQWTPLVIVFYFLPRRHARR